MNILHLDLGREMRGGQRQVLYLAHWLDASRRFRAVIAAPRGAPLLDEAVTHGVTVVPLPSAREWHPGNFVAVKRLLDRGDVDAVHTHDARAAALGALLKVLGPVRFKLVHTRRVSYAVKGWWSREKYRLADRVACVSAEIGEAMAEAGVARGKLRVIHSGIDPTRYTAKSGEGDPLVIGAVGALTLQKGMEVLLEALGRLAGRPGLPRWRAVIVGDGKLGPELKRRAAELGLPVEFAGYRESREMLPGMDIFAVPSVDGEGSSGVVKEAWTVGVPLVATDLPSNLELVEPEASGLVARRGDAGDLALQLGRLLADGGLRRRLAEAGKERVRLFTDRAMAEAYMRLYAGLYPGAEADD